jgi:hypothetical protein
VRASVDLIDHRDASDAFLTDNLNPGVLQLDVVPQIDAGRLSKPFGVDPTVVSPAAKSITREPIASSCRDQQRRKTFNSRFPYDRPWRHGFPYIVWTIADGILVATIALSENKCFSEHLYSPLINTVLNGKIRSHPRFHAQQVR